MKKKSLLFVVGSDLYTRNYVHTSALDDIYYNFEISFLVDQSLDNIRNAEFHYPIIYFKANKVSEYVKRKIFNILTFKYRNNSSSFNYRIRRFYIDGFERSNLNLLKRIKLGISYYIYIIASLVLPLILLRYISSIFIDQALMKLIKKIGPEIIVFPSAAYSSVDIDIILIGKKLNLPTLMLIDNWDNLSSKSVMWEHPDAVGVWGEQSKNHAVDIQNFSESSVKIIGCARFQNYFDLKNTILKSKFDFPYVLFVGTSLYFNEFEALKKIDNEINSHPNIYGNLKIIYRPHPWRLNSKLIEIEDLKSVLIDPQIEVAYYNKNNSVNFQPSLDYYPSLIKNSIFVVGGFTTMLLESSLFYKKYIGLCYKENSNTTSPDLVLKNYTHFRGLENINSIVFCDYLLFLPKIFKETYNSHNSVDPMIIDEKLKFFIYNDSNTYSSRLNAVICDMLSL